jgi:hypothetical protein
MSVLSICATLLVMLSALYFLNKVRNENPGIVIKWTAYLVLLVATGLMVFQLSRSCSKVWHRKMCSGTECGAPKMHKGGKGMNCDMKMHGCGPGNMHCSEKCEMSGKMDCCKSGMGHGGMKMECDHGAIHESTIDTVDGKVMIKETVIINKEK